MTDECRSVEITTAGHTETIRVHGGQPPSVEAAAAIGQIVEAARNLLASGLTVRQRTVHALREHWPEGDRCRCGRFAPNATIWSAHLAGVLDTAGLLALDRPEPTDVPR